MKKVLREYSKSPTRESSSCKLSKTQMWIPSMSGVSETAACPPSPITDDPSLYRLPRSSLSSRQQLFQPVHPMPASVCHLLYYTCSTVLFKVLYCKLKNVFFSFCVFGFFMYYLCEKYNKHTIVYDYITDHVSWVPGLILLNLQTHSWKRTYSYVGD